MVTVRVAAPNMLVVGSVAVIFTVPAVRPMARPVLLTVATVLGAGFVAQVKPFIRRSPPSEYTPNATNWWLVPLPIVGAAAVGPGTTVKASVTTIPTSDGAVTVTVVEPVTTPATAGKLAEIVVVP